MDTINDRLTVSPFKLTWKYHIAQNGGEGKLWRVVNFKNLVGKTLVNYNESSLSSSIKTHHLQATLNLNPQSFTLSSHVALKWCGHL